ncbi:MAG TPA: TonB-dependent receptor [Burkholderiaceae bacterium]|nr:TonB-dependent receptor [Burkholderiaceae bacterium]
MTSNTSPPGLPRSAWRPRRPTELALAALAACGGAGAQEAAPTQQIVITGSGVEQRAFDTPYAIGVVDGTTLRAAGPMVNLSESLARVPGLVVNARQNYAQDLQISSRGFGARAGFGVRGIRLYSDGVPASTPDGQGQVAHFDLAGAERIEVLRGPFSALYGNASGGVIAVVSTRAQKPEARIGVDLGSDGLRQWRAAAETPLPGGFDLRASASGFATDGHRPQSAAERRLVNLRLGWEGSADRVTLSVSHHEQPADDPLGLTRAQFDADPTQTTPQAITFDTRKTVLQEQAGAQWRHRFADASGAVPAELMLSGYTGSRAVTQWLAIAPATQANPRHPGGVIDFARQYSGADLRFVWRWTLGGQRSAELVAGTAYDEQIEARRGFENFTGVGSAQLLGVTGRLRRDESNRARSSDVYAQARIEFAPAWTGTLGARSGTLKVRTADAYLSNGDDSGALAYRYTTPVAALQWRAAPGLNLHLSAGRGFESPTLTELAYRPDGSAGFNTALLPQKSRQVEVGAKWRGAAWNIDAAIFRADTRDEIGIATNAGGRSTFTNVGRTRRQGVEFAARWQFARDWRAQVAATWLDAVYRDPFLTCAGIPCSAPTVPVPAGNRIAGTMKKSGFAELAWRVAAQTELGAELRAQGGMTVNDVNSDASAGVWIGALRATHTVPIGAGRLELLARIDNVTGRRYAGSVIVGESNGRFFEPAPGRTWLLGATWRQGW